MISSNHLYQIWPKQHHAGENETPSNSSSYSIQGQMGGRTSGETYSKSRMNDTRKQGIKTTRYTNQYVCN
jgi:hypothetical protein